MPAIQTSNSIGPKPLSVFRSGESRSRYLAAYDAFQKHWPLPYDDLYLPTGCGETHIIASGAKEAPPLLLFHSAGSSALQWWRNVEAFSKHFRTYAVDTIGEVNRSIPTRKITRRSDFVDWMRDLFDLLEIERADMVGNSYGGFLVCNTAISLSERIKKGVLISPAAAIFPMPRFYIRLAYPYKFGYLLGWERLMLSGYKWLWQGFPREPFFREFSELGKTCGFPTNMLPPPVFSDEDLRGIRTPMLLLIGDHEVIYRPEDAIKRAVRLMPGLKAEIIPNANHNAQVTAPEVVNRKILDFLKETTWKGDAGCRQIAAIDPSLPADNKPTGWSIFHAP